MNDYAAVMARRQLELRMRIATFIREFPDRVRATFRPDWSPVYDVPDGRADCALCQGRKYDVPAPAGGATVAAGALPGAVLADSPPSPALNLMLPCRNRFCRARANAPCVNRWGEPTTTHKVRRDDVAAAEVIPNEP